MKKTIFVFLVVIALFLSGCANNSVYYSTPQDAYKEYSQHNTTVNFELDTYKLDDDLTLWFAVTTDLVRGGCILSCVMQTKGGEYRIADKYSNNEVYTDLNKLKGLAFSDSGWYHSTSMDSENHYLWQWVSTESLPSSRNSSYTYKDYSFNYGNTKCELTLVIYKI